MSRRSDMHGFTLIELLITLALLTIVAGIAVPNFTAFIQKTQLQGQADDLVATLQRRVQRHDDGRAFFLFSDFFVGVHRLYPVKRREGAVRTPRK